MDVVARATYRGQVTKIANSATDYLKTAESQANESNVNRMDEIEEELTVLLERLTAAHQSLCKINNSVGDTLKADDLKKECEVIAEYEDKAITVISRLKQRLTKLRSFHQTKVPLSDDAPAKLSAKLPKLALKTFSGELKEWLPFWECFRTAVHDRDNITECDKFNFLQLHLTGKAAESIAGFIPSADNYQAAISLLQEEYGDEERLIDHVMQQLMSLSHVSSRRDASGLRRLYNAVTTHTRTLTAFGVPSSQYSVMLKTFLLRCLPDEMVVDFYRSHKDTSKNNTESDVEPDVTSVVGSDASSKGYSGDRSVGAILKYLKGEVESLERSLQVHGKRSSQSSSYKVIKTAAGLLTSNEPIRCCFCGFDSHVSEHCSAQLTIPQRKEILMKQGRCFKCLHKGHSSRGCRNKFIRCSNCKGRHPSCLCDPNFQSKSTKPITDSKKISISNERKSFASTSQLTTNLCSTTLQNSTDVYLQTACVVVKSPSNKASLFIRIILDGGSQRSYIKQSVAERLGLEVIDTVKIRILPFGSTKKPALNAFKRVRVVLKSQHDDHSVAIMAIVVPEICLDVLSIPCTKCSIFPRYSWADDRKIGEPESGINLLIGADYFWNIVLQESQRIKDNLVAINTIFGWTLQGPVMESFCEQKLNLFTPVLTLHTSTIEEASLERFWDLETLGIRSEAKENMLNLDFKNYVKYNGQRYEGNLLWKDNDVLLDNHRYGALQRFERLVQKLSREPKKLLEYDEIMWELISSGVAEKVNESSQEGHLYYLPHRPVYRTDKTTTKVRIVFDASARTGNNSSLNDQLFSGPNLLPDVISILLNFRANKIALVADIEKAFLQISLSVRDRDTHRFFWFNEKVKNLDCLPEYTVYRMTRVTFGVACSPFLLCATLKRHFEYESKEFPQTCALLQKSFYMDDLVLSVKDCEFASQFYRETCSIVQRAAMNIRKWNSNDLYLRRQFKEIIEPSSVQKVLGLVWYCRSDEIAVDLQKVGEVTLTSPTKRNVLQLIARIYDPLGMLGPFVIKLKILFQEAWRLNCAWDEMLPNNLQRVWSSCVSSLPYLKDFTIPRFMFKSDNRINQQLHIFCDASIQAYGAVAYARSENEDGSVDVRYICSKCRVSPLKNDKSKDLTLPKLELTAALIAARLANYLLQHLNIVFESKHFWSDSIITLHWINNTKRKYQPYVTRRVQEIHQLTKIAEWHHCPGESNPADLITRGISGKSLLNSTVWTTGPLWLSTPSDNWPKLNNNINNPNLLLCLQVTADITEDAATPLMKIENISSYSRLLRITAYVIRFTRSLKRIPVQRKFLTAEELRGAEMYWIKIMQYSEFRCEINALRNTSTIPKASKILTLNPILDENNVLRVGSRLQETDFIYDESFPIIMPKFTYFTTLLIADAHERTLHGGINVVLTRLREKFWIIKGRQAVKTVISRCRICKRLRGKPISQPFAPLPKSRIDTSRPFETTGVDFAGPLYVRDSDEKDTKKSIRAIHLELVPNLNAESCLSALRRFFARRGIPKVIISDNARTFKRASIELRQLGEIIESEKIQGCISNKGISWQFIVERAAWWGGFWERLVKLVKDVLKATIGRSVLTSEQLQTLLVEAESIINARPLTYMSDDPIDLSPLTPSHFLLGYFSGSVTSGSLETSNADIRMKWKARLKFTYAFLKRFKTEYIQRLRSAHHSKRQFSSEVKVGDVVIVYDQLKPRLLWSLAVIETVFPGRDGKIRACEIRFHNGSKMRRPVQHLYPLEVSHSLPAGGC